MMIFSVIPSSFFGDPRLVAVGRKKMAARKQYIRGKPTPLTFPLACSILVLYECMQRNLKALASLARRNCFLWKFFHLVDAYHAQIGMRINVLSASTTCRLLSVWGAQDTS